MLISTLLISTVVGIYLLGLGYSSTLLLWPLVYLLAISPAKFILTTALQAFVTIVALLVISWINSFPNVDLSLLCGLLFILSGVYILGRVLSLLKETYQVNQEQFLELEQIHEELKSTHAELQKATLQSMQYAALTERTRIAREIHDGLGHQMTSLIVQLQALELMLPNDPQTATKTVHQLLKIARLGMEEIRITVHEWENDEKGLGIIALRGFISQTAANSKIQFHLKEEGEFSEWPENISITMFRILQESITNVIRHSGANEVDICIRENEQTLFLVISDNGQFTNKDSFQNGFGVRGMIERCQSVGGACTFTTNGHGGLTVTTRIPLAHLESN
ncbi:sensor histidine kinase [Bacillus pseudomycoides]|uniref:histidine kinase n=1 Tax=Bacillus bingmayongensis TaxID=1150157 RepID=A0ABU5JSM7_9BACI|nr:sensor histidine kinase [Bacillus pseudomycoides]